jgi:hypothetical protein
MSFPFGMCPHHRLVVRCSDNHTIVIGEFRIFRIVIVEGASPHRRPEIIPFHPEDQLKYLFIKLVIKTAILFEHPSAQCRGFVVNKNASVFYFRTSEQMPSFFDEQFGLLHRRNIRPPIPRRNTDFFGDVVNSVDRSAFITTDNHQGPLHIWKWILNHLDRRRLPLIVQSGGIDFFSFNQVINEFAVMKCAGNNYVWFREGFTIRLHQWLHAGYSFNVILKIFSGDHHSGIVIGAYIDRRHLSVLSQNKISV